MYLLLEIRVVSITLLKINGTSKEICMNKYGVLLIGGRRTHQEMYAKVFNKHPLTSIVGVSDPIETNSFRKKLSKKLANEYQVPYFDNLNSALENQNVQIVSSAPEVEKRGEVALKCIEAGKHLYLDKPLCGDIEEAKNIVIAAKKHSVKTQMFSMVHLPWVKKAKQEITKNSLGKLKALHIENIFSKGKAGTVPKHRIRKEKTTFEKWTFTEAKREMFDIGVYPITLANWLTKDSAKSVIGITGNYIFKEHSDVDVEDFGSILIKFESGVNASIIGGRFGWTSHPSSGPQKIILIGENSTKILDSNNPRIEIYNNQKPFNPPPYNPLDPMGMWKETSKKFFVEPKKTWIPIDGAQEIAELDINAFIDCIEKNKLPEIDAQMGYETLKSIIAGYISASKNQEIYLSNLTDILKI